MSEYIVKYFHRATKEGPRLKVFEERMKVLPCPYIGSWIQVPDGRGEVSGQVVCIAMTGDKEVTVVFGERFDVPEEVHFE